MNNLNKYVIYGFYLMFFLTTLNTCNSCQQNKDNQRMRKSLDTLDVRINNHVYTKEQLDIKMEIEGLKASRRTLYDWNSVVRTVNRPDDLLNKYSEDINQLEKRIK
jgi:hypothetical protein